MKENLNSYILKNYRKLRKKEKKNYARRRRRKKKKKKNFKNIFGILILKYS